MQKILVFPLVMLFILCSGCQQPILSPNAQNTSGFTASLDSLQSGTLQIQEQTNKVLIFSGVLQKEQGIETTRIEAKQEGSGYLYTVLRDEKTQVSKSSHTLIPPYTVEFFSPAPPEESKLLLNENSGEIHLSESPFSLEVKDGQVMRKSDFLVNCYSQNLQEAYAKRLDGRQSFLFSPGTGEYFKKAIYPGDRDMTYPYVNFFSGEKIWFNHWSAFPSESYYSQDLGISSSPRMPAHFGREHCQIHLGAPRDFSHLPFKFGGELNDGVIAITMERSDDSKCREILQHQLVGEVYTDTTFCYFWVDKDTSLRAINLGR